MPARPGVDALPSSDDVAQMVAYATKKGCYEGKPVCPLDVGKGTTFRVGNGRVRSHLEGYRGSQAFTHLALISAAYDLDRRLSGAGGSLEESRWRRSLGWIVTPAP